MALAISSFPDPLSPDTKTGASERATRPTILNTSCRARDTPMILTRPSWAGEAADEVSAERRSSASCSADSRTERNSNARDSFRNTSCAPRCVASMTCPVVGNPAIKITRVAGDCALIFPSNSMPSNGWRSMEERTTSTCVLVTTLMALSALSVRKILRSLAARCLVAQSRNSIS